MNAIITVVGSDKVGIIANVSSFLAEHKINIADITQTILSGNFVVMMMVDFDKSDIAIDELRNSLAKKAEAMGVEINVMSEKVFSAMHRVRFSARVEMLRGLSRGIFFLFFFGWIFVRLLAANSQKTGFAGLRCRFIASQRSLRSRPSNPFHILIFLLNPKNLVFC